jgi:Inhibitor of Apoptosis domain
MLTIMSASIDFQAFTSSSGEFIIKELAIISHQDFKVQHWIFKPPYSENCVSAATRKIKTWLENNHHGIKWSQGNTDFTRLKSTLLFVTIPYKVLYVKGKEKAKHLQTLLERHVIDIADLGCPALKDLPHLPFYCKHHQETKMQCALQNVFRLAQWCMEQSDITNMKQYSARLKTFKHFPSVNVKPEDLAESGFYYCHKNDTVTCVYCNVELSQWQPTDKPQEEHKRWSPRCPLITSFTLGPDVCGIL